MFIAEAILSNIFKVVLVYNILITTTSNLIEKNKGIKFK